MSDAETKSIRPIAITLLCLFMVFGGVVSTVVTAVVGEAEGAVTGETVVGV